MSQYITNCCSTSGDGPVLDGYTVTWPDGSKDFIWRESCPHCQRVLRHGTVPDTTDPP